MNRTPKQPWTVQSAAVALIAAASTISGSVLAQIPVAKFGSADFHDSITAALADGGVGYCLIVYPPSFSRLTVAGKGSSTLNANLSISLRHSPRVADTALPAVEPLMIVDAVWKALAVESREQATGFMIAPTPLEDAKDDQGVFVYAMNFTCEILFKP